MSEKTEKTPKSKPFLKNKLFLFSAIVLCLALLVYAGNRYFTDNEYPGVPKRAVAFYKEGVEALEKNDPEKALNALIKAIELDATFGDAHARAAEAYFVASMKHKAAKNSEMANAMLDQSAKFVNNALSADPENGYAHLVLGYHAYEKNNLDNAIDEFEEAQSKGVHTFELHTMLGYLYNEKEETAKCIEQYKTALELRPGDLKTLYNLGELFFGVENYAQAIQYYGELLKYDPKDMELKANYAASVWKNGDVAKAKELFNQILDLAEGGNFNNYNTVAWVLIDKDVDIEWGIKMALVANEIKPNNIGSADILGWGYYKKNDFANAVKYLNKSMNLSPSDEVKRRLQMAKEKLDAMSGK